MLHPELLNGIDTRGVLWNCRYDIFVPEKRLEREEKQPPFGCGKSLNYAD